MAFTLQDSLRVALQAEGITDVTIVTSAKTSWTNPDSAGTSAQSSAPRGLESIRASLLLAIMLNVVLGLPVRKATEPL